MVSVLTIKSNANSFLYKEIFQFFFSYFKASVNIISKIFKILEIFHLELEGEETNILNIFEYFSASYPIFALNSF
jgi:hypothetical protein